MMFESALAGMISGIFARLISTPFDVLKIRFQLQLEPISKKHSYSKYVGIRQAMKQIIMEEGPSALWKGTVPGLVMYAFYGGIQFSCYNQTSRFMIDYLKWEKVTVINFVGGCLGGGTATIFCQPLDVIRTRLVGQGYPKQYVNLRQTVLLMYKESGVQTFYKGLIPSLLLIMPQAGMHFGFYSLYISIWRSYFSLREKHPEILHGSKGAESLVCGGLAGMTSKSITLPLDVIKKRLQVQGFEVARKQFGCVGDYNGLLDTVRKILQQEGLFGFYKGMFPGILKTSITTSVSFYTYEYVLSIIQEL